MSNNTINTITITDRRGVALGTWVRGEVFNTRMGDKIRVNSNGQWIFMGKILNVSEEVKGKLVAAGRVRVG